MTVIRPRLMIIGHGRHGKDTVAEWLRDKHGYKFVSSSWFMAERVMMPAFEHAAVNAILLRTEGGTARNAPIYGSVEECYADRARYRQFWFDEISKFNGSDLARLTREIFSSGNDIYVGLRNHRELHAAKIEGAYDLCIWIDAKLRMPSEGPTSCTVQPWMADYILDNNGTLEDLDRGLTVLYNKRIKPLEGALSELRRTGKVEPK